MRTLRRSLMITDVADFPGLYGVAELGATVARPAMAIS